MERKRGFIVQQQLEAQQSLRRSAAKLALAEARLASHREERDDAIVTAHDIGVRISIIAATSGLSRRAVYDVLAREARA